MSIIKPPTGTRGKRKPPRLIAKAVMPLMMRLHRRSGDTYAGMDLVYLTTIGAKSGEVRRHAVARFDDGQGGWYVVASAGGAAAHPAWYHNIVAHPDQVKAEVDGLERAVAVEQLAGAQRASAWDQIVREQDRYRQYAQLTDREIPVLRLTQRPTES